jgi:hypothetical protein
MDQFRHEGFLALGQMRAVVLEQSQSNGKNAALISLDFGDGGEPVAVVLLTSKAQGIRIAEVFQPASGDSPALFRGLVAYGRAVESITASAEPVVTSRFSGRTLAVTGAR